MIKRVYIYLTLLACALGACSDNKDNSDARDTLLVSIEPQRKILEDIVGDRYKVVSVLTNGANPETYEPSVMQRKITADAKAYFKIGDLPFETMIETSVSKGTPVVDTSKGIKRIHGTHSHHHGSDHGDEDPHVWTSLRNGKQIAANMLETIIQIDPDNKSYYNQRYDILVARLDSLDTVVSINIKKSGTHAFAVWHPSLSYFANDYNLHQISVGQESKETSMNKMQQLINEAKNDGVKIFFFQKAFDSGQAQSLNKEIGSKLVIIDPLAYEWEKEIISISDELSR